MTSRWASGVLWALVVVVTLDLSSGMIHDLTISKDARRSFSIETFGFRAGGVLNISVHDFELSPSHGGTVHAGFIISKTESETVAQAHVEESVENELCLLDELEQSEDHVIVNMNQREDWTNINIHKVIAPGHDGFYQVVFARCSPKEAVVSFKMNAVFYNPGPDYLSAGQSCLPTLFLVMAITFFSVLAAWLMLLRKNKQNVHHIHHLMSLLLLFKVLLLFFDSIRYQHIKYDGDPGVWNILYYIFAFLKGIMLFTVILLIGTGWSIVKHFLNDKEKKIVFVVGVLQIIDNIALVIMEEAAPGSISFMTWRDILHLVDIICCCAILFPIVWQIRHLRRAAGADGKAAHNLLRLTQYREFYVMVVVYIYTTRIAVYLLGATLPYQHTWLQDFFLRSGKPNFLHPRGLQISASR